MQQHLKLPSLLAFIPHVEHALELASAQADTVYESEFEWPLFPRLVAQSRMTQAKVEFYTVVASGFANRPALAAALAEELPP